MDVFKILWLLLVTWKFCFVSTTTTMDVESTTTTTIFINSETQTNNETTIYETTTESLDYLTLEDAVSGDYNELEFTTVNDIDEITTNYNEPTISVKDIFKESNKNEHRGVSIIRNWLKSSLDNNTQNNTSDLEDIKMAIKDERLMQERYQNSIIDEVVNEVLQEALTGNGGIADVTKENMGESGDKIQDLQKSVKESVTKSVKENYNKSEEIRSKIQPEDDEEELLSKMNDNIKMVQILDGVVDSHKAENAEEIYLNNIEKLSTLPMDDATTNSVTREIENANPISLNQEVEVKQELEGVTQVDDATISALSNGEMEIFGSEITTPNSNSMYLNQKVEGKQEAVTPVLVESIENEDFTTLSVEDKDYQLQTTTIKMDMAPAEINYGELFRSSYAGETTTLNEYLTPNNNEEHSDQELEVIPVTKMEKIAIEDGDYNLEATTVINEDTYSEKENVETTTIEANMDNTLMQLNTSSILELQEVLSNTEILEAVEESTTEHVQQNITIEDEFLKPSLEREVKLQNNPKTEREEIVTTETNNMYDNTIIPIINADKTITGNINISKNDIEPQTAVSPQTLEETTTHIEKHFEIGTESSESKPLETKLSNSKVSTISTGENNIGKSELDFTIVTDSSILDVIHQSIELDNSNHISSVNVEPISNNLELEGTGSDNGKNISVERDEDTSPGNYNDIDFIAGLNHDIELSEEISDDEGRKIKDLNLWGEDNQTPQLTDGVMTTTILPAFDPSNKYLINTEENNSQMLDDKYDNENAIADLDNTKIKQINENILSNESDEAFLNIDNSKEVVAQIMDDNNLDEDAKSNNSEISVPTTYEEIIAVTPINFASEENVEIISEDSNGITATSSNVLNLEEITTEEIKAEADKEQYTQNSIINKVFITEENDAASVGVQNTSEGIFRNKDSRDPKFLKTEDINVQVQSQQNGEAQEAHNFDYDIKEIKGLSISDLNLQLITQTPEVFITPSEEKNLEDDYKSMNSLDNNEENLLGSLTKNNIGLEDFKTAAINENQEQSSARNEEEDNTTNSIVETTFITEEYENTEPTLSKSSNENTESDSFETTEATSENLLTTGFMKLFSYFSPVTYVPKLEDIEVVPTEVTTEVVENIDEVTILPIFDNLQEITIKKIDLLSSDNTKHGNKMPEMVSESIEFVNNGNFIAPNSTSTSLTELLKLIPLLDVTAPTYNYEERTTKENALNETAEELLKLIPVIDVSGQTQNSNDQLNQTGYEDYGEVTDSRRNTFNLNSTSNTELPDFDNDNYSTTSQEEIKETQFNGNGYIGTLLNRMIKNMKKTSIKEFSIEDTNTTPTTRQISTTESLTNTEDLIVAIKDNVDNSELDTYSPQITTLKSDDMNVEEIDNKIKDILNLQDLSDYIDEIEDNFLQTNRKIITKNKQRLFGRIENPDNSISLVYNISAVLVIEGVQMSIPSDAVVLGKWTLDKLNLNISWKAESTENFNNSVNLELIDDFGRVFLKYINIMIFDSRGNEIVVRQKNNINEETKYFDSINLDNVIFEGNVILRFTDSNLKVIRPILAIDGSQSFRSKNLLALQIASGSACTFMILIATGTLIFRRIRHKARVFKVSL